MVVLGAHANGCWFFSKGRKPNHEELHTKTNSVDEIPCFVMPISAILRSWILAADDGVHTVVTEDAQNKQHDSVLSR